MLKLISDCHASKRVPEALAGVEPHAAASIRQKCIWMETIRIKPVPSVPGSFLLLVRHLFLPNPAPINFFQAWIQLSQSKNSRVNAFLLPMHTLQTDIVEIFSRKALKKLPVGKYSWRTYAGQHGQLRQLAQVAPPLTQNIKVSMLGMWPLTVILH